MQIKFFLRKFWPNFPPCMSVYEYVCVWCWSCSTMANAKHVLHFLPPHPPYTPRSLPVVTITGAAVKPAGRQEERRQQRRRWSWSCISGSTILPSWLRFCSSVGSPHLCMFFCFVFLSLVWFFLLISKSVPRKTLKGNMKIKEIEETTEVMRLLTG